MRFFVKLSRKLALSNILSSVTQMLNKFFAFDLAPLLYNIGIIAGVMFFIAYGAPPGTALAAVSCSSTATAQNGISVAPSHGSVFYIDTGNTPVLDSGYIGYRVTNKTGSTQTNLWAEVSNFTGSNLILVNNDDANMKLASTANNATSTAYYMLKATGATASAQTHTLKIYDRRPDLSGAAVQYECDFTFSKVKETIKAAANKLANNGLNTSAAIEVSNTSPKLGELLTITVEGNTGQIGAGASPDFDIIWLAPAAISSWPTRALRLESVSITFDGNKNWGNTGDQVTYTDQLLISSANGLTNVDGSEYRATYKFRVIGSPQSTVKAVPVAQISSGTQVKHSDTGATGGTLDISFSALSVNATLTKSIVSTTGLTVVTCSSSCVVPGGVNGQTYASVPYRLTATTTSVTALAIDEIVDTPGAGTIFVPSSATITDIDRTNVAISNPIYLASESGLSPRPNHFIGPFSFVSGTDAVLNYSMWIPVGEYINTAYAMIGDFQIGATASAKQKITVTSDGTSTISAVVTTESFGVDAITNTATNITSTTATLNGTVDPNGTTPLIGKFVYGTDSNLVGATTATATTPASGTLGGLTDPTSVSLGITGLSSATIYYYQVATGVATGTILSFQTNAVLATPTVTTNAATVVTSSTATFNGTINPNLTPITAIQFVYGTSSTLSTGNATTTLGDLVDGVEIALTAGGSSAQEFSTSTVNLISGTTYYYKILACTASSGSFPDITCSASTAGSIVSFIAASAPSVTTSAPSSVTNSSMTLNGSITATGGSDATQSGFAYGTDNTLATVIATSTLGAQSGTASFSTGVSGLSSNTTYYIRAYATNSAGTSYGSIVSTTTAIALVAPSVTTSAPTSVTNSSMTLNGSITSTGGSDATQSGFAYGTSATLATVIATSTLGAQSGTASFSTGVSGLSSNTTYYIRAYATNSAGTSYGSIVSTITPVVTSGGGGRSILPVTTPPPTPTPSPLVITTTPPDLNQNYKPEVCSPYLTSFIRFGDRNNSDDVKKLQVFLNTYERENLEVDGIYDQDDVDAVKRFQTKHSEILSFWNITAPTGYVYITTQKTINKIYCEQTKKLTCQYFNLYTKEGDIGPEVLKIKSFLNLTQGESLNESSNLFDASLTGAINKFQLKHASKILAPWGIKVPTGWWYQSTRKTANDLLGCFAPVRLDNGKVLQ